MTKIIRIASSDDHSCGHVVFIHGLGGHAYDTWRRDSSGDSFWPAWLALDLPGVNVWSVSYAAPATNWVGNAMPLQDRASNALETLLHEPDLQNGPLVFVCHSLGGLLLKQILREANDRQKTRVEAAQLIARVKGVVFVATPHTGSTHANWLDRLRLLLWPSAAANDLVRNDPNLRSLNVWYRGWSRSIAHLVFYETRATPGGVIVEASSADAGLADTHPIPIDADHIDICKPADRTALLYVSVRDFARKHLTVPLATAGLPVSTVRPLAPIPSHKGPVRIAVAIRLLVLLALALLGGRAAWDTVTGHRVDPERPLKVEIGASVFTSSRVSLTLASHDARPAVVSNATLELACGPSHASSQKMTLVGAGVVGPRAVTQLNLLPFIDDVPVAVPTGFCQSMAKLSLATEGSDELLKLEARAPKQPTPSMRTSVVLYRYDHSDPAMYEDLVGALRTSIGLSDSRLRLVELPDASLSKTVKWSRPGDAGRQKDVAEQSSALVLLSGDIIRNDPQIRLRAYIPDGSEGKSWEVPLPSRSGHWFETVRDLHSLVLLYALTLTPDSSPEQRNIHLARALAQADALKRQMPIPEVTELATVLEGRIREAARQLYASQGGS